MFLSENKNIANNPNGCLSKTKMSPFNNMSETKKHLPVLLEEVKSSLAVAPGQSYLDVTAGYAGHAEAILETILKDKKGQGVLVDRDQTAIEHLQAKFSGNDAVSIIKDDFYAASKQLSEQGKKFDVILADLGVSSEHLDNASRGFAFNSDGPLDMRMDKSSSLTARDVVNAYNEKQLNKTIKEYGEEPRALRIARAIISARQEEPIETTKQLANIVQSAIGGKRGKTHPATKTFQAIRIEVNDELELLQKSLPLWLEMLNAEGKLAIITFHSLEDRIVKNFFKEKSEGYEAEIKLLNKKPIVASKHEIVLNPRSRSAKLRVAAKINT